MRILPSLIAAPLYAGGMDIRNIVVLTGAGVSAESGLATFRGPDGLWEGHRVEDVCTPEAFARDPALVHAFYDARRDKLGTVAPNAAHEALARLDSEWPGELLLVTQNVDDLHERGGSDAPVHLHGTLFAPRCFACAHAAPLPPGIPDEPEGGRRIEPPHCSSCGGRVRPGVVWFGEPLPATALKRAFEAARSCDLLLSVGTSSLVYPAADIPMQAHRAGATVVQVNPNPTDLDNVADFNLRGSAAVVLPALMQRAFPE
jgi:NAD-dependent deacetylase